ncbi:uncharacterized protein LOC122532597 [Frieseomelitta varia]|uniref:uncharacterized protein LOC122532597 n=1 Tax=Frieseomelitta varia TaxID=561572 RepID=UPI001CB6A564|nr:uncharacterized protein LOC122532597 [Frieseomelitta varia]
MSQICPSSSHQLVAAAMAFRRARRKFPKNFGLYSNAEDTTKFDNIENVSGNEEANDQGNLPFPPRNCSNARSSRNEGKTFWNDECGESGPIKGNSPQKPIICSCCRKRNDQCNAGDALDIVPSKEHNGITQKSEFFKSEQVESCNAKGMKSFTMEPRNSNGGSYCYPRRRSPRETSKLDSVNLLYGRDQNEVDNVKSSDSSEKRNCNNSVHECNVERRGERSHHRNSRCTFASQKDNHPSSSSIPRACHFHCAKHSTLDLLQPHRDCCRQNRHHCCHSHDHCHHRCDNEHSNCSSKEKRLASDTCLCSSNFANNRRNCCHKEHATRDSVCNHSCCAKDSEKISTVQEQNDEEPDDSVASINHKDSLCILVEKYKTNKKCKHKALDAAEFPCEPAKDECCDKSFTSETSCQLDEIVKQGDKYSGGNKCRFRDNRRASIGRTCRHGCGPIFTEGECNQFKNLKSRLMKTGTCCSAKGTPWRHTF